MPVEMGASTQTILQHTPQAPLENPRRGWPALRFALSGRGVSCRVEAPRFTRAALGRSPSRPWLEPTRRDLASTLNPDTIQTQQTQRGGGWASAAPSAEGAVPRARCGPESASSAVAQPLPELGPQL